MTILCRRILASNCCLEREDFEIGYVIGYKDLVLSVVYDMTQMANTSLEMIAETYFLLQQNLPNYCIFQLMVFNKHIIGLCFGMLHLNDRYQGFECEKQVSIFLVEDFAVVIALKKILCVPNLDRM